MPFITRFSALLLVISLASAHPTHPPKQQRRSVDLGAFRLHHSGSSYVNVPPSTSKRNGKSKKRATSLETITDFIHATFPGKTFRLKEDRYTGDNGVEHFYLQHRVNDIDVDNANLNINLGRDGSVLSYGHSLFIEETPPASTLAKRNYVGPLAALEAVSRQLGLAITVDSATAKLVDGAGGMEDSPQEAASAIPSALHGEYIIEGSDGAYQAPKAKLVYIQEPDGNLTLAWRVETDVLDNWLLSYVDATTASTIMGVVEYVAHSSYTVFPWGQNDPTLAPRVVETDPFNLVASPFTWLNNTQAQVGQTTGNNAIAQANWNANDDYTDDHRPTAAGSTFNFPLNLNEIDATKYIDASVTQLFYTSNMFHDLLYTLGFNEAAGNFQEVNTKSGGIGGDPVILNSQDGTGSNNANFVTPPDGSSGRMRMYLWGTPNTGVPLRDSSFDADIVIHEYTHGLSNRLTGGPANSACLDAVVSAGMGEGWSDFFAVAVNMNSSQTRATNRPMAPWVINSPGGIRFYPYSTSTTVNPLTYVNVNNETILHSIGTVWNTMLYEILWNLIDKHGFNGTRAPTFSSAGVPTDGRYLAMRLVMDAMALQPCNPTFIDARNAIVDADKVLTGGQNACQIWTGFAKRGLGFGVQTEQGDNRVNDFTIPAGVC